MDAKLMMSYYDYDTGILTYQMFDNVVEMQGYVKDHNIHETYIKEIASVKGYNTIDIKSILNC